MQQITHESAARGSPDSPTDEQAHLRAARKRSEGNVEAATIGDVDVGPDGVVLSIDLPWTARRTDLDLRYDLDDTRDLLQLEELCERSGFRFEQAGHLDGTPIDLRYTGGRWVPDAHAAHADGGGGTVETFRSELRLLARSVARSPRWLRRAIERVRGLTTRQTLVAAVVVKKLVIVALLAHLLW